MFAACSEWYVVRTMPCGDLLRLIWLTAMLCPMKAITIGALHARREKIDAEIERHKLAIDQANQKLSNLRAIREDLDIAERVFAELSQDNLDGMPDASVDQQN